MDGAESFPLTNLDSGHRYIVSLRDASGQEVSENTKPSLYSRHYSEACNEWQDPSRGLEPGQHSFEETSQRWRAVGYTLSDLTGPGIEPRTSHADSDVCNHYANWLYSVINHLVMKVNFMKNWSSFLLRILNYFIAFCHLSRYDKTGRLAQLLSARYRCGRSGVRCGKSGVQFPGWSNRHSVANSSPPLRRFFGAV